MNLWRYELGVLTGPLVAGEGAVPEQADLETWFNERVVDSGPGGSMVVTATFNVVDKVVDLVYSATPLPSLAEAQAQKNDELLVRHDAALHDGVPVTINGVSAVARSEQRDWDRYAFVHDPAKVPAPGLLAVSLTEVNGKFRFTIVGAVKIESLLDQFLSHRTAADAALDVGLDDIAALADAQAVLDYDVEALLWPPNTLP